MWQGNSAYCENVCPTKTLICSCAHFDHFHKRALFPSHSAVVSFKLLGFVYRRLPLWEVRSLVLYFREAPLPQGESRTVYLLFVLRLCKDCSIDPLHLLFCIITMYSITCYHSPAIYGASEHQQCNSDGIVYSHCLPASKSNSYLSTDVSSKLDINIQHQSDI